MDDWQLLRSYTQKRSEEAFSELIDRHARMVYSAALRQAHQRSDLAEEITQKTFCLLVKKAASLPERGFLAGWLYRTACHLSREAIRAESRRRVREEHALQMCSIHSDPTDESQWHELAPLLDDAVDSLPEQERLVIVLRYLQGKTMSDVALAFGISEAAAKMRVSRAVEKLRQLLAKQSIKVGSLALSSWLAERSSEAVPSALASALKRIYLKSFTIGSSLSFLSKARLFMAGIHLQKAGALALLGIVGFTVAVQLYEERMSRNLTSAFQKPADSAASPASRSFGSINENAPELNPISLTNALENLRKELRAPWPNPRRTPVDRIERALALFGKNRKAAVPVLMRELTNTRGEFGARSLQPEILAVHGLTFLGADASEALPNLTRIFLSGDLAYLNDALPKLFAAVDPHGTSLPQLIEALKIPNSPVNQLGLVIEKLIAENPGSENTYRPLLADLLVDANLRYAAAFMLATLDGKKELSALPVLTEALDLESLRDPGAYDPIVTNNVTFNRENERSRDENLRLQAINSFRAFGPEAMEALPKLIKVAQLLSPTDQTRRYVLEAIGAIDPEARDHSPEIDRQVATAERGHELAEKAKQRSASFDELVEGLKNPDAVGYATQAMENLGEQARTALPELVEALDRFDDYYAAQSIKELQPDLLIEQLKQGRLGGLNEIANALGELGPAAQDAVPYLDSILIGMNMNDPNLIAVAEAIQKIDPAHPKTLYHFQDLNEATAALLQAIYDNHKTTSPVYDVYITDFQDQNNVGRPQLLRFVEATKADPELHDLFVAKLLQKNPALAKDLTANPH